MCVYLCTSSMATAAAYAVLCSPTRMLGFGGAYFGGFTHYRSNQPGADPVFWNNLHAKEFWNEIPTLVTDGIAFLSSGGQKTAHFSQYAAVDDVESAPKKKATPAKKKAALPAKKAGGPPPRKSGSSEDGADEESDDEESN